MVVTDHCRKLKAMSSIKILFVLGTARRTAEGEKDQLAFERGGRAALFSPSVWQ